MSWHADGQLLERYANGDIDEVRAYSLEAHLLTCDVCRAQLAAEVDPAPLDRMWDEVAYTIDAPRPGIVERALVTLGMREHVARLLAATTSLRLSWFASEAIALAFAVLAAKAQAGVVDSGNTGLFLFLMVAALLPLAGVAVAYGPGVDPTYEVGQASPMRSFRLLLIRSVAVLATSATLAGVAALALPKLDWTVAAWLLPSFGLAACSLALATYVRPLHAAGAVLFAWFAVVITASTWTGDRLVVFRTGGQIAFLLIIAASAVVLSQRREAFERRREI